MGRGNFRMKPINSKRLQWWVERMIAHAYDRNNGGEPPFVVSAESKKKGKLYDELVEAQVESDGAIALRVNRTTDGTDPTGDLVTMTLGSFLWLVENFVNADRVVKYVDRQEFIDDLQEFYARRSS